MTYKNKYVKVILAALVALTSLAGRAEDGKVIRKTDGSITFVVDEGLTPIEESNRYFLDGEKMAKIILSGDKTIVNGAYNIVATSFADTKNLRGGEKDAFFQCVLKAYKMHKSLTLSPEMIWMLISQGFARYVNAHSDELRPRLVSHEGKMDLAIETELDLLSGEADYEKLVSDFASEIAKYTKEDIAQTLTSDFSATLPAERIASQITLMESVKSYFQYQVHYAACGIPSITLKGTSADWQRVLAKTCKLAAYGLADWTGSLEPILTQFVLASEGHPKQEFWQSIVKKEPTDRLKGDKCSTQTPTRIDGWLLKLFPDENGQTLDSVSHTGEMPSERIYVGLKYRIMDSQAGTIKREVPMELMAGFIGEEEDTLTGTLTPKIGWLLRQAETDEVLLSTLQQKAGGTIDIRVKDVPEFLAKIPHINRLELTFTDGIVLPEWFNQMHIDHLKINGTAKGSESMLKALAKIGNIEYLRIFFAQGNNYYLSIMSEKGENTPPVPTLTAEESQTRTSDRTPDIKVKDLYIKNMNKGVLPDWFSRFSTDNLTIKGKMTKAEKRELSKQLRHAGIGKFVISTDD